MILYVGFQVSNQVIDGLEDLLHLHLPLPKVGPNLTIRADRGEVERLKLVTGL